jgi:hypothetical protein
MNAVVTREKGTQAEQPGGGKQFEVQVQKHIRH